MPHLFLIPSLIIHILGRCIYMELPISFPYITLMYICILFLHYSSPYSQGKILFDISFKNWYNSVLLCPINCKMPFADVLLQTVLSPWQTYADVLCRHQLQTSFAARAVQRFIAAAITKLTNSTKGFIISRALRGRSPPSDVWPHMSWALVAHSHSTTVSSCCSLRFIASATGS